MVSSEPSETAPRVVGRERELAAVRAFLAGTEPRTLVLSGGAGIGKTTLWEAGIHVARERGARVLAVRPHAAEAGLAFAGLIDLCDGVGAAAFAELPRPQRRALELALLRVEPAPNEPEPEPQQQYAPPPAEAAPDPIEQLKQLGALHEQGILTDEEFAAQKARILNG